MRRGYTTPLVTVVDWSSWHGNGYGGIGLLLFGTDETGYPRYRVTHYFHGQSRGPSRSGGPPETRDCRDLGSVVLFGVNADWS